MVVQEISFVDSVSDGSNIVIGAYNNGELSKSAHDIDDQLSNEITKIAKKSLFSGKLYEKFSFASSSENFGNIVLIGLGEPDKVFTKFVLEKLGAAIYSASAKLESAVVNISADDIKCADGTDWLSLIAFGSLLKSWTFDKYKTKKEDKTKLSKVQFVTADAVTAETNFSQYRNLADSIFLTRTVVTEPANVIYPKTLAEIAQKELLPHSVNVEILSKDDMAFLGMNALLGVAQGSVHEPKLVVLTWNGAENKDEKPIAFVGKGVTFDSGGISLKPSDGMEDMRGDMAGAATVMGLVRAAAMNKLPVNIVGVMGLVENMPSGTAQRPGDIVKSMSGQTIEVLNTDAEGRLVLADALWYAQNRFSPKAMIDLATLTGAIVVALGHEFAGLFSNNDGLSKAIQTSAQNTGEKVWRMPMTENFDRGIDSDYADVRNTAKPNVRGSSITAAEFLQRFVNNTPWAHIDIAGVENVKNDLFICNHGATGFGVHLLYDLLTNAAALQL